MLLTTDLGKSFQDANSLMKLMSDDNLFGEQIRHARKVKL